MYTKWLVALLVSIAVVNCQNTTAHSPNVTTSTVAPTTTKATQSTTVPPVTTTTTLKPTTTPAPKTTTVAPPPPTPPKPESWNGTVTDQNNTVCIMAKFAVQIDIAYNNTNSSQLLTGFIVPSDAVVDHSMSRCSANESEPQVMAIRFSQEEHTSANLTLVFNKTNNDIHVQKVELSFTLTKELFPGFHDPSLYGTDVTFSKDDLSLFKVASAHSYVCSAAQPADLGSHEPGINDVKIDFLDSQVEAYMQTQDKDNRGKFDSAIDCKSTEISDVVPIAVGAALAGLVVIVLIAYFIGRRRSRRLAYQSV